VWVSPNTMQALKIFIADDSALIRDRVSTMLTKNTMTIAGHASTAQLAIDGILATRPDVVVLDVRLTDSSGLQVLQTVRNVHPEIAFVIFSNESNDSIRQRFLSQGAFCFLDKSSESEQLVRAVQNAANASS
jgi:DNA-binding NarL/FixJ family response regulator